MKKLFISILFLSFWNLGMSQNESQIDLIKDVSNIDFYGVDFSIAKVYGAKESTAQFTAAFEGINTLLVDERSKYDIEKFLRKDNVILHLDHLKNTYANILTDNNLMTSDKTYEISGAEVKTLIDGYNVDYKYEIGAVLIGELLNKSNGYGTYCLAFFYNNNKNIIAIYQIKGEVGGFGLRNFWAKSVLTTLEKAKKTMK